MLSVTNKAFMLSVVMLSVIMLNVEAPERWYSIFKLIFIFVKFHLKNAFNLMSHVAEKVKF